jgi:hypothetical protein
MSVLLLWFSNPQRPRKGQKKERKEKKRNALKPEI